MSTDYTQPFRVRSYECDLYQHVNNAQYLRYLQEAALSASVAAGYTLDKYREMGFNWWAQQTDIEYIQPLRYGDTAHVSLSRLGFNADSLVQAYEIRKSGSDEFMARAQTVSILLERPGGQALPIPSELHRAFFPKGAPEVDVEPFPAAPPPPPGVFKFRRCVAWQEVNAEMQVEPAMLLMYVEECGFQVVAAFKWPLERMLAENFGIILRRNQVKYLQPLKLGDEIEIATWASNIRRITATRHYQVTRVSDGAPIAMVHALGVWVDLKSFQPVRIREDFLDDFAPNLV